MQHLQIEQKKNDIDMYVAEEPLDLMIISSNILFWLKDNSSKYTTLSFKKKIFVPNDPLWLKDNSGKYVYDFILLKIYLYLMTHKFNIVMEEKDNYSKYTTS